MKKIWVISLSILMLSACASTQNQNEDVVNVPLLGKVTAGSPIEAIEVPNEFFALPTYLIPNKKEVFTQTSLFLDYDFKDDSKLVKKIKNINPLEVTPLEALNILAELKEEVETDMKKD